MRQLFTLLEGKQKQSVLSELLEHIPWLNEPAQLNSCNLEDWPPLVHIRWICAKFAIRCYLSNDREDSIYALLVQMSRWNSQSDNGDNPDGQKTVINNKFNITKWEIIGRKSNKLN